MHFQVKVGYHLIHSSSRHGPSPILDAAITHLMCQALFCVLGIKTNKVWALQNTVKNIVLGWPKSSFGFFHILQKNPNKLFGQPSILFYFIFLAMPLRLRDLSSPTKDRTPAVRAPSANHWTAREFPKIQHFKCIHIRMSHNFKI